MLLQTFLLRFLSTSKIKPQIFISGLMVTSVRDPSGMKIFQEPYFSDVYRTYYMSKISIALFLACRTQLLKLEATDKSSL